MLGWVPPFLSHRVIVVEKLCCVSLVKHRLGTVLVEWEFLLVVVGVPAVMEPRPAGNTSGTGGGQYCREPLGMPKSRSRSSGILATDWDQLCHHVAVTTEVFL